MSLPSPAPGHTVLVTGASSGIGAAIARELARRGHGLTLAARRAARLEGLAGELRRAHGVRVEVAVSDLEMPEERERLVADEQREVAGLVNAAGTALLGPFGRLGLEHELRIVRVNVEALHHLTALVLPGMLDRGTGAVLNLSSIVGVAPLPRIATYAATKAFVGSFGEALHAELAGTGVSCTTLYAGPTPTEIWAQAGEPEAPYAGPDTAWTEPEEVARAGVDGMVAGRRTVVPGWTNKVATTSGRLLPRTLLLPVFARVGGERLIRLLAGRESDERG